jgi:hypothetical protein
MASGVTEGSVDGGPAAVVDVVPVDVEAFGFDVCFLGFE